MMSVLSLSCIVLFLAGLYFYAKYSTDPNYSIENFSGLNRCPNILIQKGAKFYLYNSKLAKVPGVNPIEFENLEDYTEFLDWQRSQGIRCPVLFLQQTYDTQGNAVYKVRPGVTEQQGGIGPMKPNPTALVDAARDDSPYNQGGYPSFDQSSYYVGTTTPLDRMNENEVEDHMLYGGPSPNPMDPNWGGAKFTQNLVDQGYYKENEVNIAIP